MLADVYAFSLRSFQSALVGYLFFGLAMKAYGRRTKESISPVARRTMSRMGFITLALVMYGVLYTIWSGAINQPKGIGAYAYVEGLSLEERLGKLTLLLPSLITAWYIQLRLRVIIGKNLTLWWSLWGASVLGLLLMNIVIFGRHTAVQTLVLLAMAEHLLVKPIRPRSIGILVCLVLLLQSVARLRTLQVRFSELRLEDVRNLLDIENVEAVAMSLASSLPGTDVLADVITYVNGHSSEVKHGVTYLQGVMGLFMPKFLGLDVPWETPSLWFRNTLYPEVEHHGFDFSALAEAYLNFGEQGFIVFFVWGGILAWASHAILRSSSFEKALLGLLTVVGLTIGLRMDLYATLKGIVYPWVAAIGIMRLPRVLPYRPASRGSNCAPQTEHFSGDR
jgi:hypothetical protein